VFHQRLAHPVIRLYFIFCQLKTLYCAKALEEATGSSWWYKSFPIIYQVLTVTEHVCCRKLNWLAILPEKGSSSFSNPESCGKGLQPESEDKSP
jgi:hypothetical protein